MARWSLLLALANLAADVPGALATLRVLQAGCTPGQLSFPTGELQHIDLMVNGLKRRFVLYAPPSYSQAAVPIPLQVLAPGAFNVPELQVKMSEMEQYAKSQKFAFAALAGERNLMNVVRNSQPQQGRPDDVAYTKAVVKEVFERVCVDDKRVYCAGYSRGARFCMRLASEMSDVFAGIAAISGVRFPRPNNATRPMPIIAFHGTKDPVNPYNGHGSPEYWYDSVPSAISQWVTFNGCTQVEIRQLSEHCSAQRHYGCKDNADVELVTVQGGGHIWPGSEFHWAKSLGFVTHEIKASELIGQFFAAHTLPCENPCKPPALSQVTVPPTAPPTVPPASTSKDLIFFTVQPVQVTTTSVASLAPTVTKTTTSTSHTTTRKPKTTQEPLAGWFGEPKTVPPGWEGETASTAAPAGWESEKTPSTAPPGWESEVTTTFSSTTTTITITATRTGTSTTHTLPTTTGTSTTHTLPTTTVTVTSTTKTKTTTTITVTTTVTTTTKTKTTTTVVYMPTITVTALPTETTTTATTRTATSTTHTLPTTTRTATSTTRTVTTITMTVTTTTITVTATRTSTTKTTTKATTMFLATETYTSTWTTTPAPTTTITTTRTTVTETQTTPPEAPALPKTTTEAARLRATTTGLFVVQTPTIAPLDGAMKRKDPNQASSAPTLPPSPHYSPPHPPQMMGM